MSSENQYTDVGKYVGLRQGEYWERSENSNYYCGGCGWKVTDHDSYCPECGGALHLTNCTKSENAKLRALLIDAFVEFVQPYGNADDVYEYSSRMREVGIEV